MLENYPDDEDANIYMGAIYRNTERWVLAQERFEKIMKDNPLLSIDNILLFYRAKDEHERAHAFIEANKNSFIEVSDYHLYKGIVYFYQKKFDDSHLELEKALSLSPDILDAKEILGHLYMIQNDFVQAEDFYQAMIESERPNFRFFGQLWLVSLRLAQGRYLDCKNEIIKWIHQAEKDQLESNKLAFLNFLAYINLRLGHFEEALEATEQALQIATELKFYFDKLIAFRFQGIVLLRMNKIEEAKKAASLLKTYLEWVEIPKFIRYHHHLHGMIAQSEKRYSVAVDNYTKAISLLSHQYDAYNDHAFHFYSLAMAYYEMKDLEHAQKQLEKIVGLTTGRLQWGDIYARSFYWLGKIHQSREQKQQAIGYYETFLEIWKEADSSIIELQDAKKQISRLKKEWL
jgi:tetratricopeptide (TPR) repeat protein